MITNSSLTVYHKIKNEHKYEWKRFYYKNVWWFGGKGTSLNKGYENANDVQIRIPYESNKDLKYENFEIGDILIKGKVVKDIKSENEIDEEYYNITSLNNNVFGNSKHIHVSGK